MSLVSLIMAIRMQIIHKRRMRFQEKCAVMCVVSASYRVQVCQNYENRSKNSRNTQNVYAKRKQRIDMFG